MGRTTTHATAGTLLLVLAAVTGCAEYGSTAAAMKYDAGVRLHQSALLPVTQAVPDGETYADIEPNTWTVAAETPVSTFSIDVDTGAYANMRRFLEDGRMPPADAVRIEERVNYFNYDDPLPDDRTRPFAVATELAPTPWDPETLLMRVGLRAYDVPRDERPAANVVMLVDVSGSMHSADKLPLVVKSLRMMVREMGPEDRISLVVYAGAAGVVLEPTPGDETATIDRALERLRAGGSTHGSQGLQRAYELARDAFIDGGINRVMMATDGDVNVGVTDRAALVEMIERNREDGIALTTLGFGTGNYNDALLEQLADHGNGNHAYIDGLTEARKVLVEELGSTLQTVAKDVKIQVEFNPAHVAEYRLIGYENRLLAREDFTDDKVDAGEVGAGHSVTALYQIVPVGGTRRVPELRYTAAQAAPVGDPDSPELAFVKLRHKLPDAETSTEMSFPIALDAPRQTLDAASVDFRFAAAVAGFGGLLRGDTTFGDWTYADAAGLAEGARGRDRQGLRAEFVNLAKLAEAMPR